MQGEKKVKIKEYPPELLGGQRPRPEWQKGLPLSVLMEIDRKASQVMVSDAHFQDYLDFTKQWRPVGEN